MSEAASAARARPARRLGLSLAVLAPLALILLVLVSLGIGRYPVPLADVFSVLVAKTFGQATALDPAAQTVVLNVRLPRVFGALVVGAGLAAA
ncbi:iron chelate uptake ABC transporter family permease subunit, partial [Methylorubrum podarium]|uniref:iron chelate uptake ABC transporter family permease subunit n=1 Tax=Methylorubrum podarium TaxID=200476 RepID=UPI001EE2E98C